MKLLAINAGSSSLKFQLFEMPSETVILKGLIERIGIDDTKLIINLNGKKEEVALQIKNHKQACEVLLNTLIEKQVIADKSEIKGVGHRVVQGGEYFKQPTIIDNEVIKKIDELSILAPLHNPANLVGIKAFYEIMPEALQVACFDTTFHTTLPQTSFLFPVPYGWYTKYGVRKYGFHGMSHQYVSMEARKILGEKHSSRLIVCHLGNGVSLTAVKDGKSIDTTMGLTPLDGIPMGTRSGAVDPSIFEYVATQSKMNINQITNELNKNSGLLGVSGVSSDSRDVIAAAGEGNHQAELALQIQAKRICDYIGAYYCLLGGLDSLIFTAGIGENSVETRALVCQGVEALGISIDPKLNTRPLKGNVISKKSSKVKVLVIPTNEELMIIRSVFAKIN